MFKKKSNLPPRPTIPSTEKIIEDLTDASGDDSLLETAKMILERKLMGDGGQEEDVIYQKINRLFKLHDDLQKNMMNLSVLSVELEQKGKDVVELSDDLKSKALKALI